MAKAKEIRDMRSVESPGNKSSKPKTGKELLDAIEASGLVGMWKDRTDINDSGEYAQTLRKRA